VRQGSELLQIPLEQLVRSGAILLAKREILTRTKYLGARWRRSSKPRTASLRGGRQRTRRQLGTALAGRRLGASLPAPSLEAAARGLLLVVQVQ